jgi:hypothetical protein
MLEQYKAQYYSKSKVLSKLHNELQPRLKEITRLNILDPERHQPKTGGKK